MNRHNEWIVTPLFNSVFWSSDLVILCIISLGLKLQWWTWLNFFPQPPSPEDYSGEVQQYEIFMDNSQKPAVTCPAAVNQCAVQVSSRVQTLSVSAVTSYGKSPPAAVPLRHSGTQTLYTENKNYWNIKHNEACSWVFLSLVSCCRCSWTCSEGAGSFRQ